MVISEPSAPSTWLLGLAHVRQRSYSIHAVILEYAKIEQVKERLLAGWLSNKLRYNFMILFRRTVNSLYDRQCFGTDTKCPSQGASAPSSVQ